jgi:type IX secretion system PorP/SprF family membrane protein
MKYLFRLIFFSVFHVPIFVQGQDATYAQFYANQLNINPANAGLDRGLRFYSHYKNQWPRIHGKIESYNFGLDFQTNFGGLGLMLMQGREGDGNLKTTSMEGCYAWGTELTEKVYWQLGAKGGFLYKQIDWSKLQFSDQIDPLNGFVYESSARAPDVPSKFNLDFSAGTLVRITNIANTKSRHLIGYSASHITRPDISLLHQGRRLDVKNTFQYNGEWLLSNNMRLGTNILFESQAAFKTIMSTIYITRKPLLAGVSYRAMSLLDSKTSDALIFHLGIKDHLKNTDWNYQFVYSFDRTISALVISTAGAHEISLVLERYRNSHAKTQKLRERKVALRFPEWENNGDLKF